MTGKQATTRSWRPWHWLVALVGVIVPQRLRADWRQEWEAELRYRETLLAQWDKLDGKHKLDLLRRSLGAFTDALLLQPRRLEDEMWQDLRFGVRLLLKQPGVASVMVIVLALGIGANTAIFSVVNALVFNPLPYPDPRQLVWVTNVFHGDEVIGGDMFFAFQSRSRTLERLAAFEPGTTNLMVQGEPQRLNIVRATASLFPALGVTPQLGRAFTPEEDRPGAPQVVVLSHEFWQRRLGGSPAIVGQELLLGKDKWTVIGVMPPNFRFLPERRLGGSVDVWMPLALAPQQESGGGAEGVIILENVFGRLKPGVSPEQSQAELELILRQYAQTRPHLPPGLEVRVTPLAEKLVGRLRRGLLVLFGAVGFVLLIACANVANLLLARGGVRRREMAIRAAMGAARKRLVRQMLTESLLVSVIGGVAGLLLAWLGVKALVALSPDDLAQIRVSRVDGTVLGFSFLATLLTGVVAGFIPALQAARIDLNESLKDGARNLPFFKRKTSRHVSPALVIGELALTLVLLVGAGLLINSFLRLRAVEPGFNPKNLLTLLLPLTFEKYPPGSPQQKLFHQELLTRLSAVPGVQAVASAGTLPMVDTGINNKTRLTIAGRPPVPDNQKPLAEPHDVSPDYFRAMGMLMRAGRGFTEQDNEKAPRVAVINETLARRHFTGENPVGKRILHEEDRDELTIVGVVADVKRYGLAAEAPAEVYRSYFQNPSFPGVTLLAIRTAGDPLQLTPAVRQQVKEVDADVPLFNVMAMEQRLSDSLAPRRFQMLLFGIFAVVALVLAAVGVYGVISYSVSRRTHEIGIRMALGAQTGDVLWLIVRQGMTVALIGVALGVTAALWLTRLMESLLFNVKATDPATFTIISLLLIGAAFLAAYLPARRATKVDPMVALRQE